VLIEYIPTFNFFSKFTEFKPNANILDFGSNCGNLLKSSSDKIKPENYTGIDVDKDAILEGQRLFPTARWVWYNRRNPAYNPTGVNVLPELDNKYDLIISYSVFSHTTFEDMIETLDYLYECLTSGGKILFTFCNVENDDCVEWFRTKRKTCDLIPKDNFVYLVENKIAYEGPLDSCIHFVAFYKSSWLLNKLSKFEPKINTAPKPWLQDCIEITKN
jgi:cyclopropane fatty-acyl-phospholipid synthase-like methyltransferase